MPPGFVALVLVELVGVVLVVVVLVELVDELVELVDGVVVVEEEVLLVVGVVVAVHSWEASWLIVAAPCPRLLSRVPLTDDGRAATALLNALAALVT